MFVYVCKVPTTNPWAPPSHLCHHQAVSYVPYPSLSSQPHPTPVHLPAGHPLLETMTQRANIHHMLIKPAEKALGNRHTLLEYYEYAHNTRHSTRLLILNHKPSLKCIVNLCLASYLSIKAATTLIPKRPPPGDSPTANPSRHPSTSFRYASHVTSPQLGLGFTSIRTQPWSLARSKYRRSQ